jgi:hypothetical protein
MQFPGVVWTSLLVALPLLAVWMQDSFPNAMWAVPVAGLMLIAAKVIQATRTPAPPPPGVAAEEKPERSKANIILLG